MYTDFIHLLSIFNTSLGVILLDKNQGFWLVHSSPHFPSVRQGGQYYYPNTSVVNGQNFICVTYPLSRFQTIGKNAVVYVPLHRGGNRLLLYIIVLCKNFRPALFLLVQQCYNGHIKLFFFISIQEMYMHCYGLLTGLFGKYVL